MLKAPQRLCFSTGSTWNYFGHRTNSKVFVTRHLFTSPAVITATPLHACLSLLYYMSNVTMHFRISVALCVPGLLTELPHLTPVFGVIFFQPMFCTPGSCWRDTIYSNSLLFVCMCDLRQLIALYLSLPF